jgi:preprotein translocase subunit SecD
MEENIMRKKLTTISLILLILLVAGCCSVAQTSQAKTWFVVLQLEAADAKVPGATEQLSAAIRRRLDALGISGDVQPQGELTLGRIRVGLPTVADRERVKRLLTAVARFEMRAIVSPSLPTPLQTYHTIEEARATAGAISEVIAYEDPPGGLGTPVVAFIVTEKTPIIDGRDVANAEAMPQTAGSGYSIGIMLHRDAEQRMWNWTGAHLNSYVAVIINGRTRSVAFVKSQFSVLEVPAGLSEADAKDLALLLRAGDIPAAKIVEEGVITKQ